MNPTYLQDLQLASFYAIHVFCFAYLALLGGYLLLSKRSAFITDITPHNTLRRATGLNMILWAITFLTSFIIPFMTPDKQVIWNNASSMADLLIIPAMCYMLLAILQKVKITRWIYMPTLPLAIGIMVAYIILERSYLVILTYIIWIQYIGNFIRFYIRTLRRYNNILKERFADLDNKSVEWVYYFIGFFSLYFVLYVAASHTNSQVLYYCCYLSCMVVWSYIFFKVERQDLLKDFWYRPNLVVKVDTKSGQILDPVVEEVWEEEKDELFEMSPSEQAETAEKEESQNIQVAAIAEPKENTQELQWIGELIQKNCIETQLYLENDLTIENFARKVGSNRTYISRYLATQGHSYYSFINKLRIDYALELIRKSDGKISYADVSIKSGYRNINTFRKAFKEITGMLPSQYQDAGLL